MRIPTILYFGAFAAMLAVDYLFNFQPQAEFNKQGVTHPQVVKFLSELDHPLDATNGEIEERRFSVGYITRVDVAPGFRIVHDPGLGKEVLARGPALALNQLSVADEQGQLRPEFSKPLRLAELVEIRVNLHAHGSNRMRINCIQEERRTLLRPVFSTDGPLKFRFLEMINLSPGRVEVDTRDLVLWKSKHIGSVTGKTERLEVLYETANVPEADLPGINATEKFRTNRSTSEIVDLKDALTPGNKDRVIDSLLEVVRTLKSDTVSGK